MRYIQDGPFVTAVPFKVNDNPADEGHDATIVEVLKLILNWYSMNHVYHVQQGHTLSPKDVRAYNRLYDILEKEPAFQPYYALEDSDAELLKRLVEWVVPASPFFRQQGAIERILSDAKEHMPEDAEKPAAANGESKAAIPKGQLKAVPK